MRIFAIWIIKFIFEFEFFLWDIATRNVKRVYSIGDQGFRDVKNLSKGNLVYGGGVIKTVKNGLCCILDLLPCNLRDKYVYLDFVNDSLNAFDSNMFSSVVLSNGIPTAKDTVIGYCMFPYRFFQKNPFLGTFFLAFAAVGTAVTVLAAGTAPMFTNEEAEAMAIAGKIIKVVCAFVIDKPVEFARTKHEILEINHKLQENLSNRIRESLVKNMDVYNQFLLEPITTIVDFSNKPAPEPVHFNDRNVPVSKPPESNEVVDANPSEHHGGRKSRCKKRVGKKCSRRARREQKKTRHIRHAMSSQRRRTVRRGAQKFYV